MNYSQEELIKALTGGGHFSKNSSDHPDELEGFGKDVNITLSEGDKLTCVVGEEQDFESYGKSGDVFFLGPSQFNDDGKTLFSGGHGRGFTIIDINGRWEANTFAGIIANLIDKGHFIHEPGPHRTKT